jgi:signal transduction histidine kinase
MSAGSDLRRRSPSSVPRQMSASAGRGEAPERGVTLPPDFLQRLAHDLRSPLNVVSGTLQEIQTDFAAQFSDQHRTMVGLAERGIRRLTRLAERLRMVANFTEPNAGLTANDEFDLVDAVRKAVDAVAMIEPRQAVSAHVLPAVDKCIIQGDSAAIGFALMEVILNAVVHARSRVEIRVNRTATDATVSVEDDGNGSDFILSDCTPMTVRSRSGLGIGLLLVRSIVASHHGRVSYESSTLPPGRPSTIGARVVLTLPLEAASS